MMKKNHYEDERVKMQRLKITSEAYAILMIILMSSMLIKQFILDASSSEYLVEAVGFFGVSVYILARNIFVGNQLFPGDKKKTMLLRPFITGIVVTVVTYFRNLEAHQNSENIPMTILALLITFASAFISTFAVLYIIDKINTNKIRKLEEKFDDE